MHLLPLTPRIPRPFGIRGKVQFSTTTITRKCCHLCYRSSSSTNVQHSPTYCIHACINCKQRQIYIIHIRSNPTFPPPLDGSNNCDRSLASLHLSRPRWCSVAWSLCRRRHKEAKAVKRMTNMKENDCYCGCDAIMLRHTPGPQRQNINHISTLFFCVRAISASMSLILSVIPILNKLTETGLIVQAMMQFTTLQTGRYAESDQNKSDETNGQLSIPQCFSCITSHHERPMLHMHDCLARTTPLLYAAVTPLHPYTPYNTCIPRTSRLHPLNPRPQRGERGSGRGGGGGGEGGGGGVTAPRQRPLSLWLALASAAIKGPVQRRRPF